MYIIGARCRKCGVWNNFAGTQCGNCGEVPNDGSGGVDGGGGVNVKFKNATGTEVAQIALSPSTGTPTKTGILSVDEETKVGIILLSARLCFFFCFC